jgi:hypothetical protein
MENLALLQTLRLLPYRKTLCVTPATAAGVTDRLWSIADMVTILEAWETAEQSHRP